MDSKRKGNIIYHHTRVNVLPKRALHFEKPCQQPFMHVSTSARVNHVHLPELIMCIVLFLVLCSIWRKKKKKLCKACPGDMGENTQCKESGKWCDGISFSSADSDNGNGSGDIPCILKALSYNIQIVHTIFFIFLSALQKRNDYTLLHFSKGRVYAYLSEYRLGIYLHTN